MFVAFVPPLFFVNQPLSVQPFFVALGRVPTAVFFSTLRVERHRESGKVSDEGGADMGAELRLVGRKPRSHHVYLRLPAVLEGFVCGTPRQIGGVGMAVHVRHGRAARERTPFDPRQASRQRHARKGAAPVKRLKVNDRHTARHHHARKTFAVNERLRPDDRNAVRYRNALKSAALPKRATTDGRHRASAELGWYGYGSGRGP